MFQVTRKMLAVLLLSMSVSLGIGAVYNWAGIGTVVKDVDMRYRSETVSLAIKLFQPSGTMVIIK